MMSFLVERVGKKLLSETEINYMASTSERNGVTQKVRRGK